MNTALPLVSRLTPSNEAISGYFSAKSGCITSERISSNVSVFPAPTGRSTVIFCVLRGVINPPDCNISKKASSSSSRKLAFFMPFDCSIAVLAAKFDEAFHKFCLCAKTLKHKKRVKNVLIVILLIFWGI